MDKRQFRRKKGPFYVLMLGIPLVFLLAAELLLRCAGSFELYSDKNGIEYCSPYNRSSGSGHLFRAKPGKIFSQQRTEFIHTRVADKLGFCSHRPAEALRACDSCIRILALGDSYTEGIGAPVDSTWPAQLENFLNSKCASEHFMVYNSGKASNDPFFAFQNMCFLDSIVNPDIIILMLNPTDFTDVYIRGGWERFRKDGTTVYRLQAPWWEWFYAKFRLARGIARVFGRGNPCFSQGTDDERSARVKTAPLIASALDSMNVFAANHGDMFIPAYLPMPTWHQSHDTLLVQHLLPESGIDLTSVLHNQCEKNYYWKYDKHCTPEGYRIVAETIGMHILKSGRAPCRDTVL